MLLSMSNQPKGGSQRKDTGCIASTKVAARPVGGDADFCSEACRHGPFGVRGHVLWREGYPLHLGEGKRKDIHLGVDALECSCAPLHLDHDQKDGNHDVMAHIRQSTWSPKEGVDPTNGDASREIVPCCGLLVYSGELLACHSRNPSNLANKNHSSRYARIIFEQMEISRICVLGSSRWLHCERLSWFHIRILLGS